MSELAQAMILMVGWMERMAWVTIGLGAILIFCAATLLDIRRSIAEWNRRAKSATTTGKTRREK